MYLMEKTKGFLVVWCCGRKWSWIAKCSLDFYWMSMQFFAIELILGVAHQNHFKGNQKCQQNIQRLLEETRIGLKGRFRKWCWVDFGICLIRIALKKKAKTNRSIWNWFGEIWIALNGRFQKAIDIRFEQGHVAIFMQARVWKRSQELF